MFPDKKAGAARSRGESNLLAQMGKTVFIGNVVLCVFLLWGLWFAWSSVPGAFWRQLFLPLHVGAPVVRLDYMHFSLFGVTMAAVAWPLLFSLIVLAQPLKMAKAKRDWCARFLGKLMVMGLVFMIPVPMLVGAAVSKYVESQGYRPCGELFEAGFMRYRRGFVLDPRLCVPPRHLKEALQRYEQARESFVSGSK